MARYVAFLRGVNVGGVTVKMDKLKKTFESLGFTEVKTLLASGNVLFAAPAAGESTLVNKIEKKLTADFGREIGVFVRKIEELQRLAEAELFAGIKVTPQTRRYVTFLAEKPKRSSKLQHETPDKNMRLIRTGDREVCSVLTLAAGSGTVDLMSMLEKEYGPKVTTRNWNTIEKILKASRAE